MKKLLLLGAMLIVGGTSFGYVVELGDSPTTEEKSYSGSGNLQLRSRGNIIDPTNKVLLVVKPTISAGPDDTSLEFNFGRMTKNDSKSLVGKFTAQVFKGGGAPQNNLTPIPLSADKVVVNINGNSSTEIGQQTQVEKELYSSNQDGTSGDRKEIGTVVYTLSPASGMQGNFTYEGTLITQVTLGQKKSGGGTTDVTTGTFNDNSTYIYVCVKNLTVE